MHFNSVKKLLSIIPSLIHLDIKKLIFWPGLFENVLILSPPSEIILSGISSYFQTHWKDKWLSEFFKYPPFPHYNWPFKGGWVHFLVTQIVIRLSAQLVVSIWIRLEWTKKTLREMTNYFLWILISINMNVDIDNWEAWTGYRQGAS